MQDADTSTQVRESLLKYLDTDTVWYIELCFINL